MQIKRSIEEPMPLSSGGEAVWICDGRSTSWAEEGRTGDDDDDDDDDFTGLPKQGHSLQLDNKWENPWKNPHLENSSFGTIFVTLTDIGGYRRM